MKDMFIKVLDLGLTVCVQSLMLFQVGCTHGWMRLRTCLLSKTQDDEEAEVLENEKISVIIPAYKEGAGIGVTLSNVWSKAERPELIEVIVADGGSDDCTVEEAEKQSTKVVHARGGRGPAVSAGARLATGSIFLILHADTQLPFSYDTAIRDALKSKWNLATAFRFGVNRATIPKDISSWPYKVMEFTVNIRSGLLQLPFGDQAIAIPAWRFAKLGGFDELAKVPILEDFILVQRLRNFAYIHNSLFSSHKYQIKLLPLTTLCHARRWLKSGVWRINLLNQAIMLLHTFAGYSPAQVFTLYYGREPPLASS